jgi:hypothetical protein
MKPATTTTNTTADSVASARTSARIDVVNTSERYELAMIHARAMHAIRTATRKRYGMKPTEPNCYDANEQSARYYDVAHTDFIAELATTETENARKAYTDAVRAEQYATSVASAINMRNDLQSIVRACYTIARWIARHS